MNTDMLFIRFFLAAVVVVAAGTVLARSGDIIAARTKLGGAWVGSVFLALATSLPEIVTDISAVRIGAIDLAVGDLFGSSMANMLILAIVSLAPTGIDLFRRAALDHVLYAALAIVMTLLAAIAMLTRTSATVAGVGVGSLVLVVTYAVTSSLAFRNSALAQRAGEVIESSGGEDTLHASVATTMPLRRAVWSFLGAAVVIVIAAPQFATAAEGIAMQTGVGRTFVGTWLVGLSTSLPELVTSMAAVRLRAFDLAVGNLFGSNAMNMTLFALLDAVHDGPPVLSIADPTHVLSALVAVVLMTVALGTLVLHSKRGGGAREPGSLLVLLGYVAGLALIFWYSTSSPR
jgi:cation:H+ antiporter